MKKKLKMFGAECFGELLFGEFGWRLSTSCCSGRVVHQNVEPPQLFHCLPDAALAERLVTDIARYLDGVERPSFSISSIVSSASLCFFKVDKISNVRALARHGDRAVGAADTAVASSDQCDLSLKPSRALRFREVLRQRMHLVFATRLPGLFLRGAAGMAHLGHLRLPRQRLLDAGHLSPGILALAGEPLGQIQHGECVRRLLVRQLFPGIGTETGAPGRARVE